MCTTTIEEIFKKDFNSRLKGCQKTHKIIHMHPTKKKDVCNVKVYCLFVPWNKKKNKCNVFKLLVWLYAKVHVSTTFIKGSSTENLFRYCNICITGI